MSQIKFQLTTKCVSLSSNEQQGVVVLNEFSQDNKVSNSLITRFVADPSLSIQYKVGKNYKITIEEEE